MDSSPEPLKHERRLALGAFAATAALVFFGTGLSPVAALTWLIPLPALLLAPRVPARTALAVAFAGYLVGTTNSWANYAHNVDVPLPAGIGISLGYAVTFALAVWVFRTWLRRGHAVVASLSAPSVWVGVLYLVSVVNPTGISGTLAGTQAGFPLVLQTAALTGAWGVEFLVVFVPAAIATISRVRQAVPVAVVIVLVSGFGLLRLSTMDTGTERTVALVVRDKAGWGTDIATAAGQDLLAAYLAEIAALPAEVTTVVLPEGAFKVENTTVARLRDPLARLARERRVDLVVGYIRQANGRKHNEALAIRGSGAGPDVYLKHHDTVSPLGDELVLLGDTGVQICMDANFPDPSRDYAAAGARLLAIPASDNDEDGWQHASTALLRGVENGAAVAWAARNGVLMLADGFGRVSAVRHTGATEGFTTVVALVRPGPGATPYSRYGDMFAWACLVFLAASLASLAVLVRLRSRHSRTA